jgi:hypothetical protein
MQRLGAATSARAWVSGCARRAAASAAALRRQRRYARAVALTGGAAAAERDGRAAVRRRRRRVRRAAAVLRDSARRVRRPCRRAATAFGGVRMPPHCAMPAAALCRAEPCRDKPRQAEPSGSASPRCRESLQRRLDGTGVPAAGADTVYHIGGIARRSVRRTSRGHAARAVETGTLRQRGLFIAVVRRPIPYRRKVRSMAELAVLALGMRCAAHGAARRLRCGGGPRHAMRCAWRRSAAPVRWRASACDALRMAPLGGSGAVEGLGMRSLAEMRSACSHLCLHTVLQTCHICTTSGLTPATICTWT